VAQDFRTAVVGSYQPVLYQLSIRAPGQAFAELATYTFPLSPSALRVERSSLSSFAETQGPPTSQGVTRIVDTYGLAPPVFTVEGTTGWDRHSTDGYILTGLQSVQLLAQFLQRYAELNQIQRQSGNPQLYALEFYDYFNLNFWQIEPVGPQGFRQTADRTKLVYYRFRWAGVAPVGVPPVGEADALLTTIATPAATAAIAAAQTASVMLFAYTPVGIATSIVSALP
jgi:hypothetical protein